MKVSEYYHLPVDQPSLDFVDVQTDHDLALFIDPTALSLLDSEWGARCRSLIQDYFSLVLNFIKDGKDGEAKALLSVLNEPNETRLGFSSDRPRGHGMGDELAEDMWQALKGSSAVKSGIIHDLEDSALMIDGVASDVISDITTNIIRQPLTDYTVDMCKEYGIPTKQVGSRPLWNSDTKTWEERFVELPVADDRPLILVPKTLVRKSITFQADSYYNVYLLGRIQAEEAKKGFVRLLKNKETRPLHKKTLKKTFGPAGKDQNRKYTPGREDVLEQYRQDKRENPKPALSHEKIADMTHSGQPNWQALLDDVKRVKPGKQQAGDYERTIKRLFDALFYPWLMYPETHERTNDGRKIIDITYHNVAQDDFFAWLRDNYVAPYVIVECKNYSGDPENPELDQLSGRFTPRRSKFGLLVCRKIANKELFTKRCRDTADEDRGFIISLDDDDLTMLVAAVANAPKDKKLDILREKFKQLVM